MVIIASAFLISLFQVVTPSKVAERGGVFRDVLESDFAPNQRFLAWVRSHFRKLHSVVDTPNLDFAHNRKGDLPFDQSLSNNVPIHPPQPVAMKSNAAPSFPRLGMRAYLCVALWIPPRDCRTRADLRRGRFTRRGKARKRVVQHERRARIFAGQSEAPEYWFRADRSPAAAPEFPVVLLVRDGILLRPVWFPDSVQLKLTTDVRCVMLDA